MSLKTCALLCLLSAIGGVFAYKRFAPQVAPGVVQCPPTKTQTQTVTKVVTVKPDGTKIERQTQTQRDETKPVIPKVPPPTEYRLGIEIDTQKKPTFRAGRRLYGDLWLEGSYRPDTKTGTIGLGIEF